MTVAHKSGVVYVPDGADFLWSPLALGIMLDTRHLALAQALKLALTVKVPYIRHNPPLVLWTPVSNH